VVSKVIIVAVLFAFLQLNAKPIDPVHDPSLWNSLLLKYIHENGEINGITLNLVNYTGFANDPDFAVWLDALTTAKIDNLTRDEVYAFYSNVYNSLAIDMMIKNACKKDVFGNCGTISGIRDIGTIVPFVEVWNKPAGTVGGKVWTLQQVEDYLLSPPEGYKPDPRLHAAIVCASVSCPNVRKGAFNYSDIDRQYNESFNNFLFNTKKGMSVDTANKKVTLSMIFNWYGGMFKKYFPNEDGDALKYIMLYLYPNHTDYVWLSKNYNSVTVDFFTYDWDANVDGTLPCDTTSRPCFPLWALLVTIFSIVLVSVIVAITIVCVRRRRAKRHAYHRINVP